MRTRGSAMAARTASRVLAGDEHVLDDVDDAGGLAVGAELEGGVGEALRGEEVALGRGSPG